MPGLPKIPNPYKKRTGADFSSDAGFFHHPKKDNEDDGRRKKARRDAGREEKKMEKTEQKNWFNLTASPALYCRYAYIDLEDHLAESLFERQRVSVKYEQEFVNPVNPYRLVVCRVLPWHREGFLKALSQLPNKMNLLGFNDYQDFCREYLDRSENWMLGIRMTA